MLGNYWLMLSVLVLILSLVFRNVPLLLVALLFFLAGGAARLWNRYCLERVDYRRELDATRVFFGEDVRLRIEVANRKPLPLPWIEIEDELPEELTLLKVRAAPSHKLNRATLHTYLSLGWYHRVTRFYTLRCAQRGYFTFGPARLRSGDLFGFFRREAETEDTVNLLVYPRVVSLDVLGIPAGQPQGGVRVRDHLFHDPVMAAGVREYRYGDSLRQVHWKATARTSELQTRLFEPTTALDVALFLDVRTMPPPFWGVVPDLLELSIVAAASVASHALEHRFRAGLYVNQNRRGTRELIKLPPSRHPDQLRAMLEALARAHALESLPMARFLRGEGRALPWGCTVLVVSAAPTEDLFAVMRAMKRAGRRVALLAVGGDAPPSVHGFSVFHVRGDFDWRNAPAKEVRF